jgi:hypothetical protein
MDLFPAENCESVQVSMFPKIFVSEFCNQLWSADIAAELHFFEKVAELKLGTAVKKLWLQNNGFSVQTQKFV